MSINLDGVFLGTKHAILAMKRNDPLSGSIINLSSIEGLVGDPNLGAYNASKGGVRLYTKSAALYCAKAGLNIRVNSIHPGYIWTPMVENYLSEHGDLDEAMRRWMPCTRSAMSASPTTSPMAWSISPPKSRSS
ncbi:SDR family oxidoreductase [Bauldia litoralis]|uniref:SDR family oxidoreductase n=1 Tax=Bauldia litoralis TaxID=665467 RepID=UPI003263B448